ncbi:glycosyltransferase [Tannockella kyphosi]|uniref:glycosyltransferase n=1 Tax=Tannockella kyphosi TaxID=2899121 RepID=UPI00201345E5|nr:glycosyltransferase [Tannockella kyphosi]
MNILIYYHDEICPNHGGIQRMSSNLAEELIKKGHAVYFLSNKENGVSEDSGSVCEKFFIQTDTFCDLESTKFVKNLMISKGIDIVLNQSHRYTDFIKYVKINFDIPIVTAFHLAPYHQVAIEKNGLNKLANFFSIEQALNLKRIIGRPYKIFMAKKSIRRLFKDMYNNSDKIVVLSSGFESDFSEVIGENSGKIVSISNFTTFSPNAVEKSILINKEKTILFVGRLTFSDKRVDRLILIWGKIYRKYPEWKLKILGDGPEKERIQKYIDRKNIQNIELVGFVKPEQEYKNASILCMTSSCEGLPMVLVEAGNYGCVPMAFECSSSLKDVIDHKKNGILVAPFDMKKYQEELEMLIGNTEYREQLQNEVLLVNEKFDKDRIILKWETLFSELLEQKK